MRIARLCAALRGSARLCAALRGDARSRCRDVGVRDEVW